MKPENLIPSFNPETMPSMPRPNIEHINNPQAPESGIESSSERVEQIAEAQAIASDVNITTPLVIIDNNSRDNSSDVANNSTLSDVPLLANDEDLIEKEWVDKAKKIISDTKDDPYLREEEVGKLQVDYIQKRYGRSLGSDS